MDVKQSEQVRAVIYQEGDMWVAQCLEYDISVQAADLEMLAKRLRVALTVECRESMARNGEAFKGIDPAPKYFHELFDKTTSTFSPKNSSALGCDGADIDLDLKIAA